MRTFHQIAWPMTAACALCAAPAFAQEARDTHFDGPYIGVGFGYTMQNNRPEALGFDRDGDRQYDDTVTTAAGADAFSPGFCHGFALGATPDAGCNPDRNRKDVSVRLGLDGRMGRNFVAGLLVEGSKNNAREATSGFSTTPAAYRLSRGIDYQIAARGRLGFTPGGGALFYATGGVSWSKMRHDFATTNTANTFTERGEGRMAWGWQGGGGAEVMLTDHVSLGLEYLFNRIRDKNYRVEVGQGTAPATNPFILGGGGTSIRQAERDFDYHLVKGTLNFQF